MKADERAEQQAEADATKEIHKDEGEADGEGEGSAEREVAQDEAYWRDVAAQYAVTDAVTNLEAGYFGMMPVLIAAQMLAIAAPTPTM